MSQKWIGILCGVGAAAIWGGMYVVSKVILEVIPPFSLISMRLILGVLVLWVIISRKGGISLRRNQVLLAMAVGWMGYGVSLGFQFVGTKLSTASNGALVTSATPAFVLIFAAWILKERITWKRLTALLVSTLGVIAVIDPRTASISRDLFLGNLSLVAAAITWGIYSVLVRKTTRELDVLPATMVYFLGGLVVSLPAAAWESYHLSWGDFSLRVLLGVLYLGVISTALAMYLWNKAFATLEAGVASLTFFAQPVVGATLGALILKEQLSWLFWAGAILIGLGMWIAAQAESKIA
jgi:drug/metabolite transporter (DMT)-like permease